MPLPRPLGPQAAPPSSRLLAWEGGQALSSDLGDSRVSEAQSQPHQPCQTRRGRGVGWAPESHLQGRGGGEVNREAGFPALLFLLLFKDPSLNPGQRGAPLTKSAWGCRTLTCAREAGKSLRPGFLPHLAFPPPRDQGKAAPPPQPSASVSRFDGAGRGPGRPPRPARRNLAALPTGPGEGPLERAQRARRRVLAGRASGVGTAPSLHPPAPPRSSRRQRRRFKQKKKNCLPGRGPASQPPRRRRAAARENNCSLLPASCPRSLLPSRSGAQPGRGRRGAGRPPGLPASLLLSASTCCGLLAPASVWGFAGPRPGSWLASSRAVEVSGLPAVQPPSLGLSWAPAAPAAPSLRSPSVPRPRGPFYPLQGLLACCLPRAPGP